MRLMNNQMRQGAALASLALLAGLLNPLPARAATCGAPASGVWAVTLSSGESATVSRSGTDVTIGACSAALAVATEIEITGAPGTETLTFDLSGGDFADASGVETWFQVDLEGGADTIVVTGTDEADKVLMGTEGINLNGTGEVEVTEKDTTSPKDFGASEVENITVNSLGSNDILSAAGQLTGDPMPCGTYCPKVTFNAGAGFDFMVGGDGNDSMNGSSGNDSFEGGAGADDMRGEDGADTFDADSEADGADKIDGGAGKDRADYSDRSDALNISLGTSATVSGNDGAPGEGDDVINLETVFAGSDNDIISAAQYTGAGAIRVALHGNDGADTLTGGAGNDRLYGGENTTGTETLNGGDGNDRLDGGDGNDTENGDAGNDTFDQSDPGNGDDVLNGGTGDDKVAYAGRTANVIVTVGSGANDGQTGESDEVQSSVEKVSGGSGDDTFTGGATADTFLGGGGDDSLNGGAGADTLRGGAGDDTLRGGNDNDKLYGASGSDNLDGEAGNDLLNGGTGPDTCPDGQGTNTKRNCP